MVFSAIERLPFDVITGLLFLTILIALMESAAGAKAGKTGARDVGVWEGKSNGAGDTVEVNVTGMVGEGSWEIAVNVETGVAVAGSVVGDSVETAAAIANGAGILDATISVPVVYSICRRGAPAASPSYAFATRLPLPVIMITIEFPGVQPGLVIISWMIGAKFGVN
jgi:hypothetical protein